MIGVLFYFEDTNKNVYSGADFGFHLWRETVKSIGCNYFGMIDITRNNAGAEFANNDEEIAYERFTSLEDAIAAHPNVTFVGLETQDVLQSMQQPIVYLKDYVHPADNVIYVVGPDSIGINTHIPGMTWVTIPALRNTLWSFAAACYTLYDRLIKTS